MLEIKFDDEINGLARRVPTWATASEIYAAEVNRQLREYVENYGEISDEKLEEELRTTWLNCFSDKAWRYYKGFSFHRRRKT